MVNMISNVTSFLKNSVLNIKHISYMYFKKCLRASDLFLLAKITVLEFFDKRKMQ